MVRKAELERPPTLPAGPGERCAGEGGFTLIEVVCVLAIIALLAAILLPEIPRGTSRSRLQAYALEIATVLKADRNAAIRQRVATATEISAVDPVVERPRGVRVPAAFNSMRPWPDVAINARPVPPSYFSPPACRAAALLR
jgi:prepilin-type N-terminal cleavage/methylation domain-containing protein